MTRNAKRKITSFTVEKLVRLLETIQKAGVENVCVTLVDRRESNQNSPLLHGSKKAREHEK